MLGVFYYSWYGGKNNQEVVYRHWKDGGFNPPQTWNSRYLPSVVGQLTEDRLYDSQDVNTVNTQMQLIRNAGIDFVIWSWWGIDTFSDHALSNFLNSGNNPTGLKHCIYYEKEGLDNVPIDEIKTDINYIKANYAGNNSNPLPNYFRLDNKAVVFVYNSTPDQYRNPPIPNYQQDLATKWNDVRIQKAIYTNLKISTGWQNWSSKSNSWHQYGPSTAYAKVSGYSSYVSAGWWSPTEVTPRLTRDLNRYSNDLTTMKNDGTPMKLLQTWNEWTEGTAIEPADPDWNNEYLDAVTGVFA